MPTAIGGKTAAATINPHNQNLETVHKIVASILGKAGCETCGRIAFLRVDFQGDPGPDLAKAGVVSLQMEGF